jgi:hypothetical protein
MSAQKKTSKKKARPKKSSRKATPMKVRKPPKQLAKKPKPKKREKKKAAPPKRTQRRSRRSDELAYPRETGRSRSGEQSGDLQGLSRIEAADSESVDELLEEGNAFEADVVAGVESAGDADEKEVRTHEVPEDDVPEEYLDEE